MRKVLVRLRKREGIRVSEEEKREELARERGKGRIRVSEGGGGKEKGGSRVNE